MSVIEWNSDDFMRDLGQTINDGLEAAAIVFVDDVQERLNRQASNKTAKGGKPSQPGEPPAKDTGTLARSITYSVEDGVMKYGVASGSPANKYALTMEYGSRGPIKPKTAKMLSWVDKFTGQRIFARQVVIQPRPFLRPSLRSGSLPAQAAFQRTIRKLMSEWLD